MTDTLTMREAKAECLEAECRRRMAAIATMPVRGFDTRAAKDAEIAALDAKLDEWAAARA